MNQKSVEPLKKKNLGNLSRLSKLNKLTYAVWSSTSVDLFLYVSPPIINKEQVETETVCNSSWRSTLASFGFNEIKTEQINVESLYSFYQLEACIRLKNKRGRAISKGSVKDLSENIVQSISQQVVCEESAVVSEISSEGLTDWLKKNDIQMIHNALQYESWISRYKSFPSLEQGMRLLCQDQMPKQKAFALSEQARGEEDEFQYRVDMFHHYRKLIKDLDDRTYFR